MGNRSHPGDHAPACAAVERSLAALSARTHEIADAGGFATLIESFEVEDTDWKTGRVELRLGATPRLTLQGTEPTDARYVDVCVLTPSGGSETTRTLLRGDKAGIIEALRSLELPGLVVTAMRELALTQRRFELP